MLVNEPRCDWIRVTTFDKGQYEKMAQVVKDLAFDEEPEEGKFLQYRGDWYSHAFHGQGEQNNYQHWLVNVSGELSQTALEWIIKVTDVTLIKCTRIDLQVTVPLPESWDIRHHVDALRESMWPSRRRKVEFYENEGPGGTIYIGSRQSDKFARIYVKFTGSDEWPLCLRFEMELKGAVADVVFKTMHVDAASAGMLLRGEFDRFPIVESESWLSMEKALPSDGMPVLMPRNLPDDHKTIRWLVHKVTPAIKRMLNSHEHGYRTYTWLIDLSNDYRGDK